MGQNDSVNGSGRTLTSIEKAFNVIEKLEELESAGVSEIARHLDIPKSTAHIYLNTLVKLGYVVSVDGEYRLAFKFLKHGGLIRHQKRFYQVAKPQVDKLANETGELGNLGAEENGMRVLLYKSGGPTALHDNAPIGEYTQMHWTALGKAIMAHFSSNRVREIIDRHGLPRANQHTITDPDELFEELERIREDGFSVEDQDRREGVLTVAAPVIDRQVNEPIGAVSVSGPRDRLRKDGLDEQIVQSVKQYSNIIELKYNHY